MSSNLNSTIVIADDFVGYPIDCFDIPKYYQDSIDRVLISQGAVETRTQKLAIDIHNSVGNQALCVLSVLKGSFRFSTLLTDKLYELRKYGDHPLLVDFIRLKSYTDVNSSGNVQVIGANPLSGLAGRHVLVVEDIVDTGQTMTALLQLLRKHKPASVQVVSLLHKRTSRSSGYVPDFTGFEIPDKFVIGFGLDYNEYFRDLSHICVINDTGIEKYKADDNVEST